MREAALQFGADGLRVLPLKAGEKTPLTTHGIKDATTEAETIARWWKRWPKANIGIATGSGLIVIDADGKEGVATLRALEKELGKLPVTYRVRTGGGGLHLYFDCDEPIRNSAGRLGAKLDVRGEGGYVVAPPSVHESGKVYKSEQDVDWIPQLPTRWIERLTDKPTNEERSNFTEILEWKAEEGSRNHKLAEFAGHIAKWAHHRDAYEGLVRERGRMWGLEDEEITKLIDSIWDREDGKLNEATQKELLRLQARQRAQEILASAPFIPPETAMLLSEFLETPPAEEEFLVDQVLGAEHNALLAAQYKAGKTTLLLNLLKSLTDEEQFLGHFNTHLAAGRVIWFNYELTEEQARRWAADMGIARADRAAYVGLRGLPNPLASDAGREWIVDFLRKHEAAVWFIDTFRASFFGENLNDMADVARYTSLIDRIKHEAGVSESILTHHFGRKQHDNGAEHGLGSVELDAWTDMRWLLVRDKETRYFSVEGRSVGLAESAMSYDDTTRELKIDGIGDGREQKKERMKEEGSVAYVREARKRGQHERLLQYIESNPGSSTNKISTQVKGNKGTNEGILKELLNEDKIRFEIGARQAKCWYIL
jgi:hypothetical protein